MSEIADQIKSRLSKERRRELRKAGAPAIDTAAHLQVLRDTFALAWDATYGGDMTSPAVLTDDQYDAAAVACDNLLAAEAILDFDETWDILRRATIARQYVKQLPSLRSEWESIASTPAHLRTSVQTHDAQGRLGNANSQKDELERLGRLHPHLVQLQLGELFE